ncbi:MAG: hypothetical protein A2845_03435 [Candidatus Lloydbacteria bacterium RIFCSPHIGHO2_01_FULL_49_22]|uniref:DUF4325 domain-containing protein n=1 Tax=Candidatus Lloydbacteria bacterium RIFCSPHIGHO2_01_FULL_49_22 TaxID=1798658 RepID=A0A1G2CYW3_9BACT|nr:MAG: hypothetical protein A2845_03435 [Candidatus Lloydbacteria bacterium RIFCSPHIGHO2_01_FULL_49_22]OGZ08984.1 MAG: hypothetical protein A3C14_03270 [Candidatus Lloydbacteria bacterium RIFCSPHIGHO2_02_FULL_50_18]
MLTKDEILKIGKAKGKIYTSQLAASFGVSRQYASALIGALVLDQQLIKIGSTRSAFYVLPDYARKHPEIFPLSYAKTFRNIGLEEHKILSDVESGFSALKRLPENVRSIFTFAFSEMLNNAIEHSRSKMVHIEVSLRGKTLTFIIEDSGVGVFRNIMQKKVLHSELEAIQDLLKGKTTTMPTSHSGEGIFFTSKVGDAFILESFNYRLTVDNKIEDVFIERSTQRKKGTRVTFQIQTTTSLHLGDVFRKYTNIGDESDYGFDKTEVRVNLYTSLGVHISRSQARRILSGLEKFKVIVFDFDKVSVVGQAFADEIYRVFARKYPHITLQEVNMFPGVRFMVERAKNEAKKTAQ